MMIMTDYDYDYDMFVIGRGKVSRGFTDHVAV